MRVEYINPFIKATARVFSEFLNIVPKRKGISLRRNSVIKADVAVLLGITGGLSGQVAFVMPINTGLFLASKMIGTEVETLDEIAISALAELGNIISGNAMIFLSEVGYSKLWITPPTVVFGKEVTLAVRDNAPILSIPLEVTPPYEFEMDLCLVEKEAVGKKNAAQKGSP